MKSVCAWCGKEMEAPKGEGNSITHGICEECGKHMLFQMGVPVQEYIDDIKAPVCIVGDDATLLTLNNEAKDILGKDISQVLKKRMGDVFECENALKPGGCGRSVCCSGCAIRNSVEDTYKTGKKHSRVPAVLEQHKEEGGISPIDLCISTEKVGDVVYLRIDSVENQE